MGNAKKFLLGESDIEEGGRVVITSWTVLDGTAKVVNTIRQEIYIEE